MKPLVKALALPLVAAGALAFAAAPVTAAPKRGGVLKFVIPSNPPSADAHRETTFGTVHPFAQFYSLLTRVNPDNPASPTDFVCDLCEGKVPAPTNGGKRYTFKIRKGVKFHDGSPLTSADIVATFNKIIWPQKGVNSARKAFFSMVEKLTAPDSHTVVFDLKYPSGAFMPALSMPYNFVYAKKILDKDQHWYEKNVMGTGPFKFAEWQQGAFIRGVRNPDYFLKGQPYLDGTQGIFARKYSVNYQAIRGGRAYIQFRGFPPKMRDDMKKALGKKIAVQEGPWNCQLIVTPNNNVKPFDDPRVRRALTLAIDRWGGSKYLSRIAIVKTVGGIVFPGHPLSASKKELQQLAGYWPDLKKSRAEARRLLKEAGIPKGFTFTLHNRGVDQPYKVVGTWLVDQWKQVGLNVKQWVQPSPPFYATLRKKKNYQVSLDFNCQSIVNPLSDVAKFLSDDVTGNQYAGYKDRELDKLFDRMNRSGSVSEQRRLMRAYEKRAVSDQAYQFVTLWWHRIILHRAELKGWKTSPSHYLNVDLANIWLEEPLRSESLKK